MGYRSGLHRRWNEEGCRSRSARSLGEQALKLVSTHLGDELRVLWDVIQVGSPFLRLGGLHLVPLTDGGEPLELGLDLVPELHQLPVRLGTLFCLPSCRGLA